VFENRLLRKSGSKRDEVTGDWRTLHNEELYDLFSLLNIIRVIKLGRMKWAGHVAGTGEERCVEGKRPLGRPGHRWEGNIKMDFQEMVCGGMDWIELARDGDLRVP
jgi:hypothetical protein